MNNMGDMFFSATSFNQDLSSWTQGAVPACGQFGRGATAWYAAYASTGDVPATGFSRTPPVGPQMAGPCVISVP